MDSKELQQIVACGETSTVQFKEHFSNQDSIAAEMVAMSNACGGMILFGIKDKTGEITGLPYPEIQQINSMLANIATNLLRPVIYKRSLLTGIPFLLFVLQREIINLTRICMG